MAPAGTRGVGYEEPAARRVVRESAGYPYFIQEYGLELWNHADASPITSADVDAVREIVTDTLARNFFGTRFQLATDAEQRYLAAMASLREPPYRPGAAGVWLRTAALVVEIVSPGDETWQKLPFYAAHGVDEVLILDPSERAVHWLGLAGGEYRVGGPLIARSGLIDLGRDELAGQIDWP